MRVIRAPRIIVINLLKEIHSSMTMHRTITGFHPRFPRSSAAAFRTFSAFIRGHKGQVA